MDIRENVPLAARTTFAIGGPARYFCEVTEAGDIPAAFDWAAERGLPGFVLGGGSNLLVSDRGYTGLALHIAVRGLQELGEGEIEAGAGEVWDDVVAAGVGQNWAGIECLSGIPGTVGATPVQNVGAYGQEVAEVIASVRAWDCLSGAWVDLAAAECGFGYRRSRFNQWDRDRFVIASVRLRLRPAGAATVRYPELRRRFPENGSTPPLAEVRAAVLEIRGGKTMLAAPDNRTAGSFFKNPVLPRSEWEAVAGRAEPPPPAFPAEAGQVKLPAAWMIEQAGFPKGYRVPGGDIGLSPRHALAIVNHGQGRATEVVELARRIQTAVDARFGLRLEPEPVQLGFAPGERL